MVLNGAGRIATDELDAFVVMPNHFHGILMINECRRGVLQYAPTNLKSPSQTIGAIVRGFKGATTKRINQLRNMPRQSVWQRNYYEHIIRDEDDLPAVAGPPIHRRQPGELG